jgi:hypothetical protein
MTTALILSSASVRRQEDKRKQSLSRLFGRSSASPVKALSLQLTTPSSRRIQSAGIESPDYNIITGRGGGRGYLEDDDISDHKIDWIDSFNDTISHHRASLISLR